MRTLRFNMQASGTHVCDTHKTQQTGYVAGNAGSIMLDQHLRMLDLLMTLLELHLHLVRCHVQMILAAMREGSQLQWLRPEFDKQC